MEEGSVPWADYAMFTWLGGLIIPPTRTVYTCKLCRHVQFEAENLSPHATKRHQISRRRLVKDAQANHVSGEVCTSYFLDAPTLGFELSSDLLTTDGKLLCSKCGARVGSFSWPGSQCSCGSWIVPALQVTKSKVDHKVVPYDTEIPESALPRKAQDVVEVDVEQSGEGSDGDVVDNAPEREFVKKHSQLLDWMMEGNVHSIRECLGAASFCLMETVKGKNLEGVDAVIAAYDRLITAHQERIRLIDPVELQAEKGGVVTTCAKFGVLKSVDDAEVFSSKVLETIWWNTKQNTVIISRAKSAKA